MKCRLMLIAGVFAVLASPQALQAQGVIRGAEEGAAAGNRAAGPVGGAVGGVVGGVEGGVKGALGIPQRTRSGRGRDRSDDGELSANQIMDQFAARTARIKADLRLTPEQEKNWSGFEGAMREIGKRSADRQVATQADRTPQQGQVDVIEQMRDEAKVLNDRSVDEKALADAAQPLYSSLDDQQRRRFARELLRLSRS
jgi:hypothetical protein